MGMTNMEKRKRSANFTMKDREILLGLIHKYRNIVENKKTGAYFIQQKKDAWQAITKKFNAVTMTGVREEQQIKHFYDNIKHRAKKSCKLKYLTKSPRVKKEITDDTDEITQINDNCITDMEKNLSIEKKEPEGVPCQNNKCGVPEGVPRTSDNQYITCIWDGQLQTDDKKSVLEEDITFPEPETHDPISPGPSVSIYSSSSSRSKMDSITNKNLINREAKRINISNASYKTMYFKKKVELVNLQKRNEVLKYRNEQKRHYLETQILKLKLKKAQKDLGETYI